MQWKSGYFAGQCSFVYYCTPVKFLNKEENTIHESDFILTYFLKLWMWNMLSNYRFKYCVCVVGWNFLILRCKAIKIWCVLCTRSLILLSCGVLQSFNCLNNEEAVEYQVNITTMNRCYSVTCWNLLTQISSWGVIWWFTIPLDVSYAVVTFVTLVN